MGKKKKLRRIALRMPRKDVRLAVEQIKKRAQAIFEANGDNIARDWLRTARLVARHVLHDSSLDVPTNKKNMSVNIAKHMKTVKTVENRYENYI